MGKIKSAVLLSLFTLILAALCFICTVSFQYGTDNVYTFNSILRMTAKDADLGGEYGSDSYLGGGYSAIYYPDGVISAKEYEDNLTGYEAAVTEYERQLAEETDVVAKAKLQKKYDEAVTARDEYLEKYVKYENAALYLDVEEVCDGGEEVSEEFKTAFANTVALVSGRYERLHLDGVRVEVCDDYTIGVFAPQMMDSALYALTYLSYTGEFSIRYGSSADSATTIMPKRTTETISDYVKSVTSTTRSGVSCVVVKFTAAGKEALKTATADAAENSATMYFMVGENQVIALTVSSAFDSAKIYIGGSGAYTSETAAAAAAVLDTAIGGSDSDLALSLSDTYSVPALYGSNALTYLYIAYGVCFVLMMAFFFVRYRRLGFVHLYTYLLFLFATILCVWSISFLYISVEIFAAVMLSSMLLCIGNVISFENARKEFALGKTMTSSVKTGYKKCFWQIFDLHIAVALIGFIVYFIALSNLSAFAFTLGLTAVFSGVSCLAVNRFTWAIMMTFAKNKGGFCNFKREETEDE